MFVREPNLNAFLQITSTQRYILSILLISIFIPLFLLDLKYLWLPSSIIKIGVILGLLLNFIYSAKFDNQQYLDHILGGALGFFIFIAIAYLGKIILKKKILGDGDSKLACLIGIWMGKEAVLISIYLSFLISGIIF